MNILNRYAPRKKKIVRAIEVPYMTKILRKEVVKVSYLQNNHLKNRSQQNMNNLKKENKKFKININEVMDKKTLEKN